MGLGALPSAVIPRQKGIGMTAHVVLGIFCLVWLKYPRFSNLPAKNNMGSGACIDGATFSVTPPIQATGVLR